MPRSIDRGPASVVSARVRTQFELELWKFESANWLFCKLLWGNGLEADSSGWIRTSNPPVNRRKTPVLPPVAAPCADAPDRELDRINTGPIDDPTDASVGRPNPRLGVSKGQEKGKVRG